MPVTGRGFRFKWVCSWFWGLRLSISPTFESSRAWPFRASAVRDFSRQNAFLLFCQDAAVAVLSFVLLDTLQWVLNKQPLPGMMIGVWASIWVGLRWHCGLYPGLGRSAQTEFRWHVVTTVQLALIHFALSFAIHDMESSRFGLLVWWTSLLFLALPARYATKYLLIRMGRFGRPVVLMGAGKTGYLTAKILVQQPAFGLVPIAVYDDEPGDFMQFIEKYVPYRGRIEKALSDPLTTQAIIAIPGARAEVQQQIINRVRTVYPVTWVTPDLFGVPNQFIIPHSIGTHASLELKNNLSSWRVRLFKRVFDLIAVAIGGILLVPLLAIIALAIRLDSPGPVVYRARRLGRGGREFFCLKFRSMHVDADQRLEALLHADPELQREFQDNHKLKEDPRVTRVGQFLRKTSLDELPQLWNVFKGEMSLVGPRPIVRAEVAKYGAVFDTYAQVRPGMTGYWQANGRSDTTYEERVHMDLFYVSNWSPWLDATLLIQTVRVVFLGKGAY